MNGTNDDTNLMALVAGPVNKWYGQFEPPRETKFPLTFHHKPRFSPLVLANTLDFESALSTRSGKHRYSMALPVAVFHGDYSYSRVFLILIRVDDSRHGNERQGLIRLLHNIALAAGRPAPNRR